jgi:adenosylcobinamide kinase / adenosylcobinamide-phosphate guanylyltransferase
LSDRRASPLPAVTLVLGGARSGKSAYAEELITGLGGGVYLATAEALDAEMAERIRRHRERRANSWTTVEEPLDLAGAIHREAGSRRPILIDCLTLWLSNLMAAERDIEAETRTLTERLSASPAPLVVVSNEVGLGIVPASPLARAFRDHAGRLNQAVAAVAQRVVFIAAGLPLILKDAAP